MTERLYFYFSLSCIGEGNGNPLQCSCLENPRVWGAWWAAVSGVAQSWTRLKQCNSSSSSMYSVISFANRVLLLCQSEFLLFLFFFFFFPLIAMPRISKTMLNNSGKIGHPCLVPGLRGNAFCFSLLRMFAVCLSYKAFTLLR